MSKGNSNTNNSNVKESKYSNSRPKGKNGRSRRSPKRSDSCAKSPEHSRDEINKTNNDISWWNNMSQLAKDNGTFSFYNQMGAKVYGLNSQDIPESIPGIMTLRYVPTIGSPNSSSDPINAAARYLYDKVNYKNSRNFSYDVPDLMLYVVAVANAYSFHAYLKRIIGLLNIFSQVNRYIPEALIVANHVDYNELVLQIPQLRSVANQFALAINKLAVPAGIPYFERMYWLNSNVYMDDPTIKAGLYMFVPRGFYKYSETAEKSGGMLAYDTSLWTGTVKSLRDLYNMGQDILRPLMNSQDIANMSTDVMKAFEGKLVQLSDITEEYAVAPVYNPEVLMQINNAQSLHNVTANVITITQDPDTNYLVSTLKATEDEGHRDLAGLPNIINMPMDNPTSDDVMIATRLVPVIDSDGTVVSCGTEVITDCAVYKYHYNKASGTWALTGSLMDTFTRVLGNATSAITPGMLQLLCDYNKFGSAPIMRIIVEDSETGEVIKSTVLSDLQNFTLIGGEEIRKLHETALLSVFTLRS